jgi:hypothetical protein
VITVIEVVTFPPSIVIPANAGIHLSDLYEKIASDDGWIPAFAGMTTKKRSLTAPFPFLS